MPGRAPRAFLAQVIEPSGIQAARAGDADAQREPRARGAVRRRDGLGLERIRHRPLVLGYASVASKRDRGDTGEASVWSLP